MYRLMFLCLLLTVARGQKLSIDSQLGTSGEDCFDRVVIGGELPPNAIYANFTEITTRECEQRCKEDKQCQSFDYGVGAKGNATCGLSTFNENDLKNDQIVVTNPDYDVFTRRYMCEQSPPKPIQGLFDDPNKDHSHKPVYRPDEDDQINNISNDLKPEITQYSYKPDRKPEYIYNRPSNKPNTNENEPYDNSENPDVDYIVTYGTGTHKNRTYGSSKPDHNDILNFQYNRPKPLTDSHLRPDAYARPSYDDDVTDFYGLKPIKPPEHYGFGGPYKRPSTIPAQVQKPFRPSYGHEGVRPDPVDSSEINNAYGVVKQRPSNYIYLEIYDQGNAYRPIKKPYDDLHQYNYEGTYYDHKPHRPGSDNHYQKPDPIEHYPLPIKNPYDGDNLDDAHDTNYKPYENTKPGHEGYGSLRPDPEYEKPGYGSHRPNYDYDKPNYGGDRPNYGGNRPNHGGDRPNYGGHRPTHGANRPTYGETPNVGLKPDYHRPGGERPTYGGHRPNYGGETPTYYGEDRPNYGGYKPISEGNGPNYGQGKPSYGNEKPNYDVNKPNYGGDVPTYGADKPNYVEHRPTYGEDIPHYSGSNPNYGGDRPTSGGNQPNHGGHRPSYGLDKPIYGNEKPNYGGDNIYKPGNYDDKETPGYVESKPEYLENAYGQKPVTNKPYNGHRPDYSQPSYGSTPDYTLPNQGGNSYKPITQKPIYGSKPGYGHNSKPSYGTKPIYNPDRPDPAEGNYDQNTDSDFYTNHNASVIPVYERPIDRPSSGSHYIVRPGGQVVTSYPVSVVDGGHREMEKRKYKEPMYATQRSYGEGQHSDETGDDNTAMGSPPVTLC